MGSSWSPIAGTVNLVSGLALSSQYEGEGFTKLAVDTSHSPPYIYAAAVPEFGVDRAALSSIIALTYPGFWGLWRSTDGGQSFTQYSPTVMGGCTYFNNADEPCPADDAAIDPSTNTVFAGIDGYGVFVSTDSGNTWSAASLPGITNGQGVGRISLAAADGVAYAMVGSAPITNSGGITNTPYLGFFKFSGSGWQAETVPCQPLTSGGVTDVVDGTTSGNGSTRGQPSTYSQASFDQALAIQPGTKGTGVAFGGVGLYYSSDSGNTWTFLSNDSTGSIHEDVHAVQFDPFQSNTLYAGTDGGIFSVNLGASPPSISVLDGTPPASIVAAELYSVAPHLVGSGAPASDAETLLSGLQDNGLAISSPSPTAQPTPSLQWSVADPFPGDASFSIYDSQNSNIAYHDNLTANLAPSFGYTTNGGSTWSKSTPTLISGDIGSIPFPGLANDPTVSQFLLFGSFYMYSSTDGMVSWSEQSGQNLTQGCLYAQPPGYASSSPCGVQDVEFAPSNHARGYAVTGITDVWTGNAPGGFYVWTTGQADYSTGATWTNITTNLTSSGISAWNQASGVAVDPHAAAKIYLPTQGCLASVMSGCTTVYTATANGSSTSWSVADGSKTGANPINSPVYKVLVDNTDSTGKHLLAGTAGGLFVSSDSGADWTPYNEGGAIPNVPVLDIEQNSSGQIFVATHGAGAYKLAVPLYVGQSPAETAENGCPNPCTITIAPPGGAQPGDAFLLVLQALGTYSASPTGPTDSDWTLMSFANQGGAQEIASSDSTVTETSWMFARIFSSNDPASYSFTIVPTFTTEFVGYLVSYRGASADFSTYTVYGYPTTADSETTSTGQLTNVQPNATLVNIFAANDSDAHEDSGGTVTFSAPTGSPSLTVESPLTVVHPYLTADVFTGPAGGTFGGSGTCGGYCTSDGVDTLNTGFQIVVPPL